MAKALKKIENFIITAGEIVTLFYKAVIYIFQKPFNWKLVVERLYSDGVKSMPVVLLTAIFTGGVLALQSYYGLLRFGAEAFAGTLVGVSLTKELIPVLTGLMIAGRVGASYSAEIGTMKVSEQVDALFTFGINPVKHLVSPRLVALGIMVPLLALIGDFVGILGGRIVVDVVCQQNPNLFDQQLLSSMELWDIVSGMIKAQFFGLVIAVVGSYYGLKTEGGAQGVGRYTTTAVVISSIIILISDFVWSKILPFTLR